MSYNVAKEELESAGDNTIGGVFVALLFVFITMMIYGLLGTRTTILGQPGFIQTLTQILLGGIILLLIAIFANYKILQWVRENAKKVIYWGYMGTILFVVGGIFLAGISIVLLSSEPIGGYILLFIAMIAGGIAYLIWRVVESRIDRAARWLSVSSGVVMSEPGMLFVSFIQSMVLMIAGITEIIVGIAFQYLNQDNYTDEQMKTYLSMISFAYIWFSFFVIYYFGGVNVHMSYARIKGVDPTLGQGISAATRRIPSLLLYSLISTIITVITNVGNSSRRRSSSRGGSIDISNSDQLAGAIIGSIFSAIGSLIGGIIRYLYFMVNFFTLPIIIIRKKGTFGAMKESFEYFKSNPWNLIISDMAFGWGVWSIYLFAGIITGAGGFIYGVALTFIFWSGGSYLGIGIGFAFIAFIVGLFVTKLFISPLYTAFTTTIYVYASEGPEAIAVAPPELISQIDSSINRTDTAMAHSFL